jgi:hypothetical protein
MSVTPEYIPTNSPAELALPLAQELVMKNHFEGFQPASSYERTELDALEAKAAVAGMLGKRYLVSSYRSISVPANFEENAPVPTYDFNEGLDFSGHLVTFSTVRIGRNLGGNAVRALCLTFDNVTLLPYFDRIPNDRLLHTPAFAVREIDTLAA